MEITVMMSTFRHEVTHEGHVGQVRRHAREAAKKLGGDEAAEGAAGIIATELATNIVKHGGGGEILLREIRTGDHGVLEYHALDSGAGMANVSACLRDGYSTAGSAGTGLGAVRRMSDQFQIHSGAGKGTVIWARQAVAGGAAGKPPAFEISGISVAVRGEELCGDCWDAEETGGLLRVMVADGLGHGPFAEAASREAVHVFRQRGNAGPADCLDHMHHALFKTRGAAASVVRISPATGLLQSAGVGNVVVRNCVGNAAKTLSGDNGTLGAAIRRVNETSLPWGGENVLVMHSDGIASAWNFEAYPGLANRHPGLIAGVIYRDFRRIHDDSTVVVVRPSAP
ncbi:MAG: Stage sporulation protein [Verrucomicrobiales bacterium]|nr:Stage sporulation protein [Verrucomicrobiales bacterium]